MKKRIEEAVRYWETQREQLGDATVDKKIAEIKGINTMKPFERKAA